MSSTAPGNGSPPGSSVPPEPARKPRPIPRFLIAVALRIAVAGAVESYWGDHQGILGTGLLAASAWAGLAIEFFRSKNLLTRPRSLDLPFVAGAGYDWRRRRFVSNMNRWALQLAGVTLPAVAGLGAIYLLPPLRILLLVLSAASLIALGTFVPWALAWMGLLRPSRAKVHDEDRGSSTLADSLRRPLYIQGMRKLAGWACAWMPDPLALLAARKLTYLLRMDPASLFLGATAILVLGAAMAMSGNRGFVGANALVCAIVSLAWIQYHSGVPDRHLMECGYYHHSVRQKHLADLLLYGLVAACIGLIALAGFIRIQGGSALADPRVWQVLASLALLALHMSRDALRPGRSPDQALMVNAGYLGLLGVTFMFPAWLAAILLGAAALHPCLSLPRPGPLYVE